MAGAPCKGALALEIGVALTNVPRESMMPLTIDAPVWIFVMIGRA